MYLTCNPASFFRLIHHISTCRRSSSLWSLTTGKHSSIIIFINPIMFVFYCLLLRQERLVGFSAKSIFQSLFSYKKLFVKYKLIHESSPVQKAISSILYLYIRDGDKKHSITVRRYYQAPVVPAISTSSIWKMRKIGWFLPFVVEENNLFIKTLMEPFTSLKWYTPQSSEQTCIMCHSTLPTLVLWK